MDFWDLTKLLFRRWYVALPLLLVTMSLAGYIGFTLKPDYVATSYVQLVPPITEESDKTASTNPWMTLGLGPLAKAAVVTVTSKTAIEQMADAGYTDNFTMTMESGVPLVTIEVTADSKSLAGRTADELVRRFTASVESLQREQGAIAKQTITVARLGVGDNLEKSSSKKKRALVAVAAAGLLLSIGLTVGADTWLRRRARRRIAGADPLAPIAGGGGSGGRPSPGYRMTPPSSDAGFGYAGGRDGDGKAAAGGSDSPLVEFRSATEAEPATSDAGDADASRPTDDAAHQESTVSLRPMGPDATIILPLSHKDEWSNRDGGSKRR